MDFVQSNNGSEGGCQGPLAQPLRPYGQLEQYAQDYGTRLHSIQSSDDRSAVTGDLESRRSLPLARSYRSSTQAARQPQSSRDCLDDWLPRVLFLLRELHQESPLSTIQETIFCQAWMGGTYREIADSLGYDRIYVRALGAQLWQSLSQLLGRRITKSNFQVLLQQEAEMRDSTQAVPQTSIQLLLQGPPRREGLGRDRPNSELDADQVQPLGGTPNVSYLSAELPKEAVGDAAASRGMVEMPALSGSSSAGGYVERLPVEEQCREAIAQPGALIRIKAPKQMGKTALVNQIVTYAAAHSFRTVNLSFELADAEIFASLDRFLQWFCAIVEDQLNLESQLAESWKPIFGSNYNCTHYLVRHILAVQEQPLLLALDDIDIIFQYPEIAADFLGLLRAWCEKAKQTGTDPTWQRLRLVVAHAEEVYVPLQHHQSPFNIGLSIELSDFTPGQALQLARHSGVLLGQGDDPTCLKPLMYWVGGKPHLLRLAFTAMAQQGLSLEQIVADVSRDGGIFQTHLRSQLRCLQHYPDLLPILRSVMAAPLEAEASAEVESEQFHGAGMLTQHFRLERFGWVTFAGYQLKPSCLLYQQYFAQVLRQCDQPSAC